MITHSSNLGTLTEAFKRYSSRVDALPRPFGPFLLLKTLGSGATGDVFLARPLDTTSEWPSPLVVKRMHRALLAQPEQKARFEHEARIALALSTPHVPRIHAMGEAGGTSYMAMDFVAGWTLSRLMRARRSNELQTHPDSLFDIVKGVLNGLVALHEAVDPATGKPLSALHRDLAPKNIMLGQDGVTRLIDLGLGKSTVQNWQTTMGVVMGTPGYMAPEQVLAEGTDARSDLYTVGIVLWELLAGTSYIPRAPLHKMLRDQAQATYRPPPHKHDVPEAVNIVLQRALAPEKEDRYESARQFLTALEAATGTVPKGPGPVVELVTRKMWDELAADLEEVTDLTESLKAPDPALVAERKRAAAGQADTAEADAAVTLPRTPARRSAAPDEWANGTPQPEVPRSQSVRVMPAPSAEPSPSSAPRSPPLSDPWDFGKGTGGSTIDSDDSDATEAGSVDIQDVLIALGRRPDGSRDPDLDETVAEPPAVEYSAHPSVTDDPDEPETSPTLPPDLLDGLPQVAVATPEARAFADPAESLPTAAADRAAPRLGDREPDAVHVPAERVQLMPAVTGGLAAVHRDANGNGAPGPSQEEEARDGAPPRRFFDSALFRALAVAPLGAVIGIGAVLALRVLSEEEAPHQVSSQVVPASSQALAKRLLRRAQRLGRRWPAGSEKAQRLAALIEQLERHTENPTPTAQQLQEAERTLKRLEAAQ